MLEIEVKKTESETSIGALRESHTAAMYAFKKQMKGGPGFFDNVDPFDFPTRPVDSPRPMKVVVIGAGMSGIIAGIFFPRAIENLTLTIYEKNADLGGTWFENNYPGIACDIPSHAYSFTFEHNPGWSSYYAPGAEIEAYLKKVANKYNAVKYMKFRKEVVKAEWNDKEGKWYVTLTDLETGEVRPIYSGVITPRPAGIG